MTLINQPLQCESQFREYLWGGYRLRPGKLTAEAWIVYEGNQIVSGALRGITLGEATRKYPLSLLGEKGSYPSGSNFPLLIKILDCNQWLSLQVHPDNYFANLLEGPGKQGKTEAWYIIGAEPGAKIIAGIRPGVERNQLVQAIGSPEILDLVETFEVAPGDVVYMPARTIHALGPGLLVYEIQQSSDITYRIYDWDRPSTAGRVLHLEQARLVSDPGARCEIKTSREDTVETLIDSPFFRLERMDISDTALKLDTKGESFHILTVIRGLINVIVNDDEVSLESLQTVVIPADTGSYALSSRAEAIVLKASL